MDSLPILRTARLILRAPRTADAWEKICAGASLIQLYTGLVYEGLGIVRQINEGLADILGKEGFRSLDEAVGCRAGELAAA